MLLEDSDDGSGVGERTVEISETVTAAGENILISRTSRLAAKSIRRNRMLIWVKDEFSRICF